MQQLRRKLREKLDALATGKYPGERLKQMTRLAELFASRELSEAWEPVDR